MKLLTSIKEYFLKQELKRSAIIFIGYQESGVRLIGNRYLEDWEIEYVNKLKKDGKIIKTKTNSITSLNRKEPYIDDVYTYNP